MGRRDSKDGAPRPAAGGADPAGRIAQGGAAMGAELAGFAARRMRAADQARREMMAARSMVELGTVQASYVQAAAADYLRHLAVLGDLGAATLRGTMGAGAAMGAGARPAPTEPEAPPAAAPAPASPKPRASTPRPARPRQSKPGPSKTGVSKSNPGKARRPKPNPSKPGASGPRGPGSAPPKPGAS